MINDKSIPAIFGEIGTNKQFVITDFQRSYEWERKNILAFIDVLQSYTIKTSAKYNIGSVILEYTDPKNISIIIVDAQQRLITIYLIACLLKKYVPFTYDTEDLRIDIKQITGRKRPSIKNEKTKLDNDALRLVYNGDLSNIPTELKSNNIIKCYKILERQLITIPNDNLKTLLSVWDIINNKLALNLLQTESREESIRVFNGLNSFGRKLDVKEQVPSTIQEFLTTQPVSTDNIKEKIKNIDNILSNWKRQDACAFYARFVTILTGKNTSQDKVVTKLRKLVEDNDNVYSYDKIQNLVDDIELQVKFENDIMNKNLSNYNFSADSKYFMTSTTPSPVMLTALGWLYLRNMFKTKLEKKTDKNSLFQDEFDYYEDNDDIVDVNLPTNVPDHIKEEICRFIETHYTLRVLSGQRPAKPNIYINLINRLCKAENIKCLHEITKKEFKSLVLGRQTQINSRERIENVLINSFNMYNTTVRDMVFNRINEIMYADKPINMNYTYEHILPACTKNDLVHTIGNLTWLNGTHNFYLQDGDYLAKRKIYQESCIKMNTYFNDVTEWNDDQIKIRSKLLSKKLLDYLYRYED